MTAMTPLPTPMDLDAWRQLVTHSPDDEQYELVEGIPEMVPSGSFVNSRAAFRLGTRIEAATGREFVAVTQVAVAMTADSTKPTVRIPDLVVVSAGVAGGFTAEDWWVSPADVALVVEVVSPSSAARDWLTKAAEYARAGVGAYLVVDPRRDLLTLFEAPVAGTYPPPAGDGSSVSLRLGAHTVALTMADTRD